MSICFYEGYLRNRLSLCRELGLPDPSGERAVLEAGFRRWGAGLPDHLYGAFAFWSLSHAFSSAGVICAARLSIHTFTSVTGIATTSLMLRPPTFT